MRQLLQNVSTGEITVEEVPVPAVPAGAVLVATRFSVISAGTERAAAELGRRSLAGKARARPDVARKVVESARTEGIAATYAKVQGRLAQPNALGYSSAGVVLEAPEGAPAAPGDLVACAGAGFASHAEVVAVPRLLCARVPDGVAAQDAAYATVAAIALHGVRLAEAGLGDVVAVVGLGLVGQLTLELLRAAGSVALGVDPDPRRADLARQAGFFATGEAGEMEAEVLRLTGRRGADAVLVTAASKGPAPLASAIQVARDRAVVCVVGDVPIEAARASLFAKELRLVVSRSSGPGRYDPRYEERGIDYPASYVRWTEGRNLEEVLRLMAAGALRPARLTSHTFDIADAPAAYRLLEGDEPSLGIILRYPPGGTSLERKVVLPDRRRRRLRRGVAGPRLAVIGAGTFARGVLLPQLARHAQITAVATATGPSARATATRYGARLAATDADEVIAADSVDAVVIATRHDTHAEYAARALEAGKHVFVEKPLAIDADQLDRVVSAARTSGGVLMVGFNRRFAPLALRLREALGGRGALVLNLRVNAGRLPASHWVHDPHVGGGRIVGEVCHFVDLAAFMAGAPPVEAFAEAIGEGSESRDDNMVATLRLGDGSVASIAYAALGDPALPKERIEVLADAGAGVLDDFRSLRLYRHGREERTAGRRDKGHAAEVGAFVSACRHGEQPWPISDMEAVTRATFAMRASMARLVAPD
jgi:predicted dehydrogenase/threonine dehydrogenase-like Zn-dependent dehydrogenase